MSVMTASKLIALRTWGKLEGWSTDVSQGRGVCTSGLTTGYVHYIASCKDLGVCTAGATVGAGSNSVSADEFEVIDYFVSG